MTSSSAGQGDDVVETHVPEGDDVEEAHVPEVDDVVETHVPEGDDVVETYSPDFDAILIQRHLMTRYDELQDSVWGFVIYRCCNASDEDWERMLQKIRSELDYDNTDYYISRDLVPSHNLHPIDDPSLYGASIDQVRGHFRSWVPENVKSRLRPEVTLNDNGYKCFVNIIPRYKYCLYVDDLCIESLDQDHADCPVVKILHRDWEPYTPEQLREIEETEGLVVTGDGNPPAPFLDGLTDDWEEDVGWMYMPVMSYLETYFTLVKWDWLDVYVRPPYIDWTEDESTFIGNWRNE